MQAHHVFLSTKSMVPDNIPNHSRSNFGTSGAAAHEITRGWNDSPFAGCHPLSIQQPFSVSVRVSRNQIGTLPSSGPVPCPWAFGSSRADITAAIIPTPSNAATIPV